MRFYHYERGGGGAEKVLVMLKAGAQKVLGQFLRSSLKFQPYFRGGGGAA